MRNELIQLAEEKGDLPPLPEVLCRLADKIEDPDSCISDIVELIQTEAVLAGRFIKLANSVFFGGGRDKVEDLHNAIGRLGLKMVLDLAYTVELPRLFVKIQGMNQMQFWRHSLVVAVCSQSLSRLAKASAEDQSNAYLGGLMHDIGVMVFAHLIPEKYSAFLSRASAFEESLASQEEKEFGIAHPELGAFFIRKRWPVDPEVVNEVRNHHCSLRGQASKTVIAANMIINSEEIDNGTSVFVPPRDEDISEQLGLSAEDIDNVVGEAEETLSVLQKLLVG